MEHPNLKLKVCGLRDPENIKEIIDVRPDYMGFIFYKPSSRYVGELLSPQLMETIPSNIKKVGVFVNEEIENIINITAKYRLDLIQLHGDESLDYCKKLVGKGFGIIKAVRIFSKKDFELVKTYKHCIDYALLDKNHLSGIGVKFEKELGGTPYEGVNALHYNMVELTASKLVDLSKVFMAESKRERFIEPQVTSLLKAALDAGQIKQEKLDEKLKLSLEKRL